MSTQIDVDWKGNIQYVLLFIYIKINRSVLNIGPVSFLCQDPHGQGGRGKTKTKTHRLGIPISMEPSHGTKDE